MPARRETEEMRNRFPYRNYLLTLQIEARSSEEALEFVSNWTGITQEEIHRTSRVTLYAPVITRSGEQEFLA